MVMLVIISNVAIANSLDQQRNDFLQAEKLLVAGNKESFLYISASLIDYPLYPYLQFHYLKDELAQTDSIIHFLTTYQNTRYAESLRVKWLIYLAGQSRWLEFIRYYQPTENISLECYYHFANYKMGNQLSALDNAKRLWLTGENLPDSCNDLLVLLKLSVQFTPELIWQRFELALDKNNLSLADYTYRLMQSQMQQQANIWLRLHRQPKQIENDTEIKPEMGRLFAHIISRLAESELDLAIHLWDSKKSAFLLDSALIQSMERRLALSLAHHRHPDAYRRLQQLVLKDEEVAEWQVRSALLAQNWQQVAEALSNLSMKQRQDAKWRYWQARTMEKTGHFDEAQTIYLSLAEDRSFYGFLAADYIHKPYQITNRPILASTGELDNLANETDFKVVKELNFFDRQAEAERQWWFAVKKLSQEKLKIAAKLAQHWGWRQVAVATLVKADYWDDLNLRFPFDYGDMIHQSAQQFQLNPIVIVGLIRQESIFNPWAESPAGAMGLMQVMPSTGKQIAQNLKEPWQANENLFKPEFNIRYGTFYFKQLLNQFGGHFPLAIAAYNAGAARVKQWLSFNKSISADIWIETIPFKETRKYVSSVLAYIVIYQKLIKEDCAISQIGTCLISLNNREIKLVEQMSDVLPISHP